MNNAKNRRKKSDKLYLLREIELINNMTEDDRSSMYLYINYCKNTCIDDLEGEIWHDIPKYEGYYKLSNFLRVKSIINNKIRKLKLNKSNYYELCLFSNGNNKYFIFSRIVASVFHPNTNNLPQVNHKNGIRCDNRISNLEWVTSNTNINHSILVLGNNKNYKKIVQLDRSGNFIKEWDSILNAAMSLGKKPANITTTCMNKCHYAYNFIWMYKYDYELNGVSNRHIDLKYKSVIQYDINMNIIKKWNTIVEAANSLNLWSNQISMCCKNNKKSCGGFKWSF